MNIHCCGIGGIGLSAYAALQKSNGHTVSGSDRGSSIVTEDLEKQGIAVSFVQDGSAIPAQCDLFVYSEAIPKDAPERAEARRRNLREISYPQAVGELSKGKKVISICGTHGKSSTTGILTRLFLETGMDPTVIVGTRLRELDGRNWRQGKSEWFILESCEYCRSFMHYDPQMILLTNCDGDHFDYYATNDEYRESFAQFVQKLPADGLFITHGGDPDCRDVAERSGRAFMDADTLPLIPLQTPGLHMRQNAQLVLALAEALGIPQKKAVQAVSGYTGSWRRMELRGRLNGAPVYDDYGHHPREITATLAGLREEHPKARILCAFQPHTHHRTRALYDAFTRSFTDADTVIIPNIYAARADRDAEKVDVETFCGDIAKNSACECHNGASLAETENLLRSIAKPDDVIVCMGAGDITSLASSLLA